MGINGRANLLRKEENLHYMIFNSVGFPLFDFGFTKIFWSEIENLPIFSFIIIKNFCHRVTI